MQLILTETISHEHNTCMCPGPINTMEMECLTTDQCQVQNKHAKCAASLPVGEELILGLKGDLKCYFNF